MIRRKMNNEIRMRASFRITNALYKKAIIDAGYEFRRAMFNIGWVISNILQEDTEAEKARAIVSELYLSYVLKCSSSTLQAILDAAEAKICRRAEKTLEAIKNELLERVIYEEDLSKNKTIDIC